MQSSGAGDFIWSQSLNSGAQAVELQNQHPGNKSTGTPVTGMLQYCFGNGGMCHLGSLDMRCVGLHRGGGVYDVYRSQPQGGSPGASLELSKCKIQIIIKVINRRFLCFLTISQREVKL